MSEAEEKKKKKKKKKWPGRTVLGLWTEGVMWCLTMADEGLLGWLYGCGYPLPVGYRMLGYQGLELYSGLLLWRG